MRSNVGSNELTFYISRNYIKRKKLKDSVDFRMFEFMGKLICILQVLYRTQQISTQKVQDLCNSSPGIGWRLTSQFLRRCITKHFCQYLSMHILIRRQCFPQSN